ncbi:lipopolysaccharide biosynthesis protein [Polynucleobacter sp. MG-6-Vaara-E2]|uniref:lipopolysaccharide biosynthesis protein n=1 Tax=Polynucleobacter sp. MG-6-Vaara-E2 TaxID=2576932 RepID=UPI001BFD3C23|nr:hypothetical protein [Polynucleobacter sp. MG-6-Vaara-E2]QWD96919.1 hypothetical protein ICV38_01750 [Polynucleobacter sp. MG-6-Vaara-E2]
MNNIISIIDKAVIFSVINKVWSVLSGILSIYFLTKYLNDNEMGYYYLISSILGIQIIFEGGFSSALMTYYSKYRDISLYKNGELKKLLKYAKKWYINISALFLLIVSVFGYLFISLKGITGFWEYPWFLSVTLTSLSILFLPYITLLESLGHLGSIQGYKLNFAIIGSISSWLLIANGFGIYSIACILLFSIFRDMLICIIYRNKLKIILNSNHCEKKIFIFSELKVMKNKLAISNLSMYFGFNLFIPVIYYYYDSETAGKMGLTWSALTAIQGIGAAILYTKYPLLVELVHKKIYSQAKKEWFKISLFSTIIVLICLIVFNIIYLIMKFNNIYIIEKFTNLTTIFILIIGILALQLINCLNIAIRSFGKELLMNVNLICNFITGLMIILMGKNYSVIGIATAFTSVILIISLPWEIIILKKLWRENVKV